ncbi:MAG: hypothetical protein AAF532_16765 [Planctomycetota bacterium]
MAEAPQPSFPKSAWLWLALPIVFGGCATFELTDELYREARRSTRMFALDTQKSDAEPGHDDPWGDVGVEANKVRPVVVENDDWWGKYVMSEKARQIERNLGVE